jgi:hypothetical protein
VDLASGAGLDESLAGSLLAVAHVDAAITQRLGRVKAELSDEVAKGNIPDTVPLTTLSLEEFQALTSECDKAERALLTIAGFRKERERRRDAAVAACDRAIALQEDALKTVGQQLAECEAARTALMTLLGQHPNVGAGASVEGRDEKRKGSRKKKKKKGVAQRVLYVKKPQALLDAERSEREGVAHGGVNRGKLVHTASAQIDMDYADLALEETAAPAGTEEEAGSSDGDEQESAKKRRKKDTEGMVWDPARRVYVPLPSMDADDDWRTH